MTPPAPRIGRRASASLFVVLAIVVTVAGIELYAIREFGLRPPSASYRAAAPAAAMPTGPIGWVDTPLAETIRDPAGAVSGWALDAMGIRAVEARIDGKAFAAELGLPRPDVREAHPELPDAARAGFRIAFDLSAMPAAPGIDRRRMEIVAIARDGRETVLATRSIVAPEALVRWRAYASKDAPPFHLLPALSGLALGAASGLDTRYSGYVSPTTRIGTRIPVLYLRTTRGSGHDYAFDPDWDVERRCRVGDTERRLSDDALNGAFRYAIEKGLPILFTLNGGIWADAACDAPQWDVNDRLEQDPANCQWSERNEVVADDHLRNLAGAFDNPELARALTLNVYAREVRRYKKRNLQQAARLIAAFARKHPDLFVGVNLDPDVYLNPFFGERAWFDYNPGTLRQFRHWLAGSGPYAGRPEPGVPDLSAYRRARPLSLAEASRLAGRRFSRWEDVDPPRAFRRDEGAKFWDDRWVREWEIFRRHLVDLHYDELSRWLVEAGIAERHIWSSQGFMAPGPASQPFALAIDSPVKDYDSGGMSVEGAKPSHGHLGAILYGAAARNDIRMEGPRSLFGAFATIDRDWAVVEYNAADLRQPQDLPAYAAAYRGLRDMWNHGARFVSPMAWTGSDGRAAGRPGYDPLTAWRNTPLEEAARDFLLARAHLSPGSRLWTFGAPGHADTDGWIAERGSLAAHPGRLAIAPDADGTVALRSPPELMLDRRGAWRVVVVTDGAAPRSMLVSGRDATGTRWVPLARVQGGEATLPSAPGPSIDVLRLELDFGAPGPANVLRVAILPVSKATRR